MPAPSLSASIVTYRPEPGLFSRALASLAAAIAEARRAGELGDARLVVIDNGPPETRRDVTVALAAWPASAGPVEVLAGHGNVGYGRANNLAIERVRSDFHLIMNPDVELEPSALREALAAARAHPEVGMLAPAVLGEDGELQYLCKRYPSVWVLFLRGFAPAMLRRRFARAIDHYEMRDVIADRFVPSVPLASGCFMLARTALLVRVGGFDPRFFMYFEDYDLSLRVGREAAVAYVPQARILHHGGEASRKGLRHVAWFVSSAWRFFARHGWKIA
ncbi:MAG TPA: glycosyltransferase [Usitatibacter sp.]|nr:glycosyltransferase [Usitatibacter sp.]